MIPDNYAFGYPRQCSRCVNISGCEISLRVGPYFKQGDGLKVMLIGQDPTIHKKPERVSEVLMLNEPNSQLSRWLKNLFGSENFNSLNLYATNLVKCSFPQPPSRTIEGALKFLQPYFQNCRDYLSAEVMSFQPDFVLALGEAAHKLFISILDNYADIPGSMQAAFNGQFIKARLQGFEFDYSPCLHIQSFRVAETYGESVKEFKQGLLSYFRK